MSKNLSLIGMPASGKSTVGVLLAKYMNMDFVDTDILIQKEHGKRLYQIIEDEGLDAFLKIEADIVCSLHKKFCVIATGGSVVYSEKAMKNLSKKGKIFYLYAGCSVIDKRLENLKERGVVYREGQSISELFLEREPLYKKWADFTISTEVDDPGIVVSMIMSTIKKIAFF